MRAIDPNITQEMLSSIYDYDPHSGQFRWKIFPGNGSRPGDIAGSNQGVRKYLRLRVCGRIVLGQRVAWFLMTGKWPEITVDHRDNDGSNNRWGNLRSATDLENSRNKKRRSDNTSGHKGVSFHKRTGKWHARIMISQGKSKSLGLYHNIEDAANAYKVAAVRTFGEFARME